MEPKQLRCASDSYVLPEHGHILVDFSLAARNQYGMMVTLQFGAYEINEEEI